MSSLYTPLCFTKLSHVRPDVWIIARFCTDCGDGRISIRAQYYTLYRVWRWRALYVYGQCSTVLYNQLPLPRIRAPGHLGNFDCVSPFLPGFSRTPEWIRYRLPRPKRCYCKGNPSPADGCYLVRDQCCWIDPRLFAAACRWLRAPQAMFTRKFLSRWLLATGDKKWKSQ